MDSFEFNKIAGAVLGTALLVLGLKTFGGELFHSEAPEKPGMVIEVADAAAAAGTESATPAAVVPIAVLLATADAKKGAGIAKACAACHSLEKGGANKVGPALWNVVGRNMGSAPGFAYSEGMKAMGAKPWDYDSLNAWLHVPKEFVKGTKMAFAGVKKDQDRADLIAYLASLSDSPVPFPKP